MELFVLTECQCYSGQITVTYCESTHIVSTVITKTEKVTNREVENIPTKLKFMRERNKIAKNKIFIWLKLNLMP